MVAEQRSSHLSKASVETAWRPQDPSTPELFKFQFSGEKSGLPAPLCIELHDKARVGFTLIPDEEETGFLLGVIKDERYGSFLAFFIKPLSSGRFGIKFEPIRGRERPLTHKIEKGSGKKPQMVTEYYFIFPSDQTLVLHTETRKPPSDFLQDRIIISLRPKDSPQSPSTQILETA